MGKSRLVWEFTHSHRTHGWLVLESRLGLLREGDAVPARHRPAEGYLPDRGARRPAGDPREGDGQAPDAGPGAGAAPAAAPGAAGRPRRGRRVGRPSTRRSAASGPWTRSSGCCSGRARSSRCSWSSRISTGSTPRPRRCSTASVESLPDGPHPAPRQLPARVPARLGRQDLLHASSGSTRCRPRAPRRCSARCWARTRTLAPLKRVLIERTEGNPSSWRRACGPSWRPRCWSGSAGPIGWRRRREAWQVPATVQAILAARIDRLAPEDKRLLQAAAVIGKDVPFALLQAIADAARGRACAGGSATSRRPSSCTRRASSRISSTPSSTPSPTRSPTGACSRTAGAPCTPGSSRRSSGSIPTGWPSRSSGWPTTPFGARCGRRRSTYLRQAGRQGARRARPYREAVACFEQALAALGHLPETPRDAASRRSTSASTCGPRSSRSASPDGPCELSRGGRARSPTALGDQRRLGLGLRPHRATTAG